MKKRIQINADIRKETGTAAVRKLRRSGRTPGVVYGAGKNEATVLSVNSKDFELLFGRGHMSENIVVELDIHDKGKVQKKNVIVKDFVKNPITDQYLHVDFYEVLLDKKLKTEVPVVLKGESPGVAMGGVLEHFIRALSIECLPQDLPEVVEVDISALETGHSIHVKDITLGASVKVETEPESTIVTVKMPAVLAAGEEGEGEEIEGEEMEPELVGKKEEDEKGE